MKKALFLLLTLVMCLALCACGNDPVETENNGSSTETTQGATEETEASNVMGAEVLKFTLLSDKTYSVAASEELYALDDIHLVIPGEYNGKAVTVIEEEGFKGLTGLVSITIPESVTTIENYAFSGCAYIENITFPNSIPAGIYFYGRENLKNLYITDLTAWCNNGCWIPCWEVPNLYIDGQLVTELVIPDGVTEIGYYAFNGCTGLTSVTIPDSVTKIATGYYWSGDHGLGGAGAFVDCSNLTNLTVSEGNPIYHSSGNCIIETESKTLILGSAASAIPADGSVTSIGEDAFKGNTKLMSITIPSSVTKISNGAFYGCENLKNLYITDLTTWCNNGCMMPGEKVPNLYIDGQLVTELVIPDGVTEIGYGAFMDCTGLTSVTIPSSVTEIGYYTFIGCTGLTSVTIPDGVTEIGYGAFMDCTGLTSVSIPDSVTVIDSKVFKGCTSLTDIHYTGTYEQWKAIKEGGTWLDTTLNYTVHCTDGDYKI